MTSNKLIRRNFKRLVTAMGLFPVSLICRLLPRSNRIWIFGSQLGYRDNSRYLFEYTAKNLPDVRAVWMGQNEDVCQQVKDSGFEVVRTRSFAGRWLAMRAGVGVISNGFGDLTRGLIGGMYIVQLWHGVPLKRLLLDFPADCQIMSDKSLVGRIANWCVRTASKYAWRQNNLIVTQSSLLAGRMASAFGVSEERVVVTGTPRTDVLLGREQALLEEDAKLKESILADVSGVQSDFQIALYAPTWREDGDEACLWKSFDPEQIDLQLRKLNTVLAVRLHPYSNAAIYDDLESLRLTHIVPVRGRVSFQTLLRCTDVLVTDYSSACADFAALRRPVVFFTPDFEKYQGSRDFYEPLEELTLGKQCATWQEVVEQVARGIAGDDAAMEVTENLRKRFNEFDDTANRERIVAEIFQRVGLK